MAATHASLDLDQLLHYVERRTVVPVVGRELSQVRDGDRSVALDALLAERLARSFGHADLADGRALSHASLELLRRGHDRHLLFARLCALAREGPFEPAPVVHQLAAIEDFPIFLGTTFDDVLLRAVRAERRSGASPLDLAFSPTARTEDLPPGWRGEPSVVYRIFGRLSPAPDDYVLTDEDALEFLHHLQHRSPPNLFGMLHNHDLLLLGCSLPDWLAPFFLRTLKNERLLESRRLKAIVDGSGPAGRDVVVFLGSFGTQIYEDGDATAFVAELHRRWDAGRHRSPPSTPLDAVPEDTIFLSYASEDVAAARNLRDDLVAAGHVVWFDKNPGDIPPADDWDERIKQAIRRCGIFVPCLSTTSQTRIKGYFREEWALACRVADAWAHDARFLWPVALDRAGLEGRAPPAIQRRQITLLEGGRATPHFLSEIEAEIRRRRVVRTPAFA